MARVVRRSVPVPVEEQRPKRSRRIQAVWAVGALVAMAGASAMVALTTQAQAASTVTTLTPGRLTTTTGATGGQSVKVLGVKDLTGSKDGWDKYVEFGGESAGKAYDGYLTYQLPSTVKRDTLTGVQVTTSYRGPAAADQVWAWSVYDWAANRWAQVGTNAGVASWGAWSTLTFKATGSAAGYASPAGEIRVRLTSSNAADNTDLDHLVVVVTSSPDGKPAPVPTTAPVPSATSTSAPAVSKSPTPPAVSATAPVVTKKPSPAPTTTAPKPPSGGYELPPANAVWDYQIGGPYTPSDEVGIVDRDHTEKPAAGKYNICYVNGYQSQPGASKEWPTAALLRSGGKLVEDKDWEGEYLVDTRTEASRTAIMSVVGPWIDSCAAKGFKGVEIDNLDSFTRDPSRQLTESGNLALARLLVARAHGKGLSIGQKNTVELAGDGKKLGFDFAVVESCQVYNECNGYTDVYGTQVYEVEYVEEGGQSNFDKACKARGSTVSVSYRDVMVTPKGSRGYTFKHC